jgi:predicted metal-dependent enzyme (double-stranded beta helix superfamily)
MTTVKTETALDRFVNKTRALFAREADLENRWTALEPILKELLSDPTVIEASKKWPDCTVVDNRAENLLFYEDPDYRFAVNGLVLNATGYESAIRIHDHAHIYTLYGLLDGHQRIERYERLDDRSKPDYAEIRKTVDSECGPGEIDLVRPYEIHAEDTLGVRAVAVIIRSEKSGGFLQGRYQPAKSGYFEGYGARQTPCAFYIESSD